MLLSGCASHVADVRASRTRTLDRACVSLCWRVRSADRVLLSGAPNLWRARSGERHAGRKAGKRLRSSMPKSQIRRARAHAHAHTQILRQEFHHFVVPGIMDSAAIPAGAAPSSQQAPRLQGFTLQILMFRFPALPIIPQCFQRMQFLPPGVFDELAKLRCLAARYVNQVSGWSKNVKNC